VADESGFTILESVIALSLIFSVLVVLLGGLTTGVRGVVIGRQRGVALALANEILEDARARAYGAVGHDLDSDPTLATDPLITGTSPNLVYTGVTPPEPLAGCQVLGLTGTCSGAKADASADNDTGTAPPDTDQEGSSGPVSASGGATTAGSVVSASLSASLGSGTAQTQATGRSCWACQAAGTPHVGDDDMLP